MAKKQTAADVLISFLRGESASSSKVSTDGTLLYGADETILGARFAQDGFVTVLPMQVAESQAHKSLIGKLKSLCSQVLRGGAPETKAKAKA